MWEIPSRPAKENLKYKDEVDLYPSKDQSRRRPWKGFDIQYRCNIFRFCDPHCKDHKIWCHNDDDDDEVDAVTLPFSPLTPGESSPRDMTVAIHHYTATDLSTPHRQQSTAASTISPLTSPRELRNRNGTYLEPSRRQLFSDDDEVDVARIGSTWRFILRFLFISLVIFAVYDYLKGSTSTLTLFPMRSGDTSIWESIPWNFLASKVKALLSKDAIDDANILSPTFPDASIIDPFTPITDNATSGGTQSSIVQPPDTTTFASLQQPRLILTPLPLALTMRPHFGTFLDHQLRQRGHWILPLASTMIPGMGWVLIVAIISRLVILGTPPPIATP